MLCWMHFTIYGKKNAKLPSSGSKERKTVGLVNFDKITKVSIWEREREDGEKHVGEFFVNINGQFSIVFKDDYL